MKECRLCNKSYCLDNFPVRSDNGKIRNECKDCTREIKRASTAKCGRKTYPKKVVARVNRWRQKNPDKQRAASSLRRAREKQACPKWLTKEHKNQIRQHFRLACSREMFENQKFDVDHIIPLTNKMVSGLHVPWNLQVIPKTQNMQKYNKLK